MGKEKKGYLIAVPDKINPEIIRYHRVSGPKFFYGDKIVKEFVENKNPKRKTYKKERKVNKARTEKLQKKSKEKSRKEKKDLSEDEGLVGHIIAEVERTIEREQEGVQKLESSLATHIISEIEKSIEDEENADVPINTVEPQGLDELFTSDISLESEDDTEKEDLSENSLAARIAREVARIMDEEDDEYFDSEEAQMEFIPLENDEEPKKRNISKPKTVEYVRRYTAPKERGLVARLINRIKYEHNWYEDIEMYLDDNYYAYNEIEESRVAVKKRDQRLYKRVQAYEDAENDITMKKTLLGLKVTAAAALLTTTIYAGNLLVDMVKDIVTDNNYVAAEQVKSTLANANSGEIAHAEKVLSKIDYEFEYLSRDELVDTIIRVGTKPSKITENKARGTLKNIGENSDQKLLEEIVLEAYEDEYEGFSDEKKQELNQVIYEMLDEDIKIWIRSPENVAKLKEKKDAESAELNEMEY